MAQSEGLALAPWGVLGSGKIQTNAEEARCVTLLSLKFKLNYLFFFLSNL